MPRFACAGFAEAFVLDSEFLFRGEIRDISQTGCYLETRARLRLERFMLIDVCFTLKGKSYHVMGRAMNVRSGKGVGIEFIFKDDTEKELFNQLFYEVSQS